MSSSGYKTYQLAKQGDYDGLKSAFSLSDINYFNENEGGNNLLLAAIDSRNDNVISFMLNNTINFDFKNNMGWTALHKASFKGLRKITLLLLAKGANPNVRDNFGECPIHFSASKGYKKIVKHLLQYSANPNSVGNNGWTPIAYAAAKAHNPVVKTLISNGADINFQGKDQLTALHFLTYLDSSIGVKILLENGAKATIRNKKGLTAPECAEERGATNVIKIFSDFKISCVPVKPFKKCNNCEQISASIRLPCYHILCETCYNILSSCNICSQLLNNTSF